MNKLYFGDNLDILKSLYNENHKGFIDLIYIDPPFNSKRNYNVLFESIDMTDTKAQKEAFADTWSNVSYFDTLNEISELNKDIYEFLKALDRITNHKSTVSYLTTMTIRIIYMHKLLKDTGSFYLHCDSTASHYLKMICDFVFGEKNFRNEIVWCYRKWNVKQNQFPKNHDVILFYTKSKNNIFNTEFIPKSNKSSGKGKKIQSIIGDDGKRKSIYLDEDSVGTAVPDWWEIPMINPMANERLGYPTQKPEALLEKIIKASSNEGDLVADFFCGCGTTIKVAENLDRRWIGVDISHLAVKLISRRLEKSYNKNIKDTFEIFGFPKDIDSAKELAEQTSGGRLKFEEWIVEVMLHGILNDNRTQMGYDGYFTFDFNGEKQIGMIEVKSGNATPTQLNHFIQTVDSKKGNIGVFVCFEKQITKNMEIIAKQQGFYKEEFFRSNYPKIQIITVEDLLKGATIKAPVSTKTTFRVSEPEEVYITKQNKLEL